jgi:uncharacterized membrane protein YcaP (DUF421 family)
MQFWRIAIRALFVYIFMLALLRLAGKRAIHRAEPFDFVVALILGDLVDDALWAEVPLAQFVVAAATIALTKLTFTLHRLRAPSNQ